MDKPGSQPNPKDGGGRNTGSTGRTIRRRESLDAETDGCMLATIVGLLLLLALAAAVNQ